MYTTHIHTRYIYIYISHIYSKGYIATKSNDICNIVVYSVACVATFMFSFSKAVNAYIVTRESNRQQEEQHTSTR